MFRLLDGQAILGGIIVGAAQSISPGETLEGFTGRIKANVRAKYRGPWGDFLILLIEHLPEIATFIAQIFQLFSGRNEQSFGSTAAPLTIVWRDKEYSALEGSQVANFLDSTLPA